MLPLQYLPALGLHTARTLTKFFIVGPLSMDFSGGKKVNLFSNCNRRVTAAVYTLVIN